MERTVVSLMCENIRSLAIDVDELVKVDQEKAIRFIHGQYKKAQRDLNKQGLSQS